jgi:hypothetical protein
MRRKLYTSIIITAFVASFATVVLAAPRYVASVNQEPFHITSCRWAKKTNSSNAVYYESREQAIADRHRACKVCKP